MNSSKSKQPFPKKAKKPAENPFDKFANSKKKHDVINRKVKGEDRNVGRARGKVIFFDQDLFVSVSFFSNRPNFHCKGCR